MQATRAIEARVLTGVDEVETRDPGPDGERERQDRPQVSFQVSADGHPGSERRECQREPEDGVGQVAEALDQAVGPEDQKDRDRELARQRIQLNGARDEDHA